MDDAVSPMKFHEFEGVEDWRVVGDGACAFYQTRSIAEAARFVQAISQLPGVDDHHPDVDVRRHGATVRLVTASGEYFGTTQRDLELARAISTAARSLGLVADPSAVQSVLVIPGAADVSQVMPFWRAVLGYEPRPDSPNEDLVDPHDRGPAFWFEQMKELRGDGGGTVHVSVWVPYDQGQARVAAALAAGGRLVNESYAPAWWTLADAAGNEACISTVLHRG